MDPRMDAASIATPTKCGCSGGIIVACGPGNYSRKRPFETAKRKLVPPTTSVLCPVCATACSSGSGRCYDMETTGNRSVRNTEGFVTEIAEDSVSTQVQERKSYTSLLRGALGILNGKRKGKRTNSEGGERQGLLPENSFPASNKCTNNNCISGQCEIIHSRPVVFSTFLSGQANHNSNNETPRSDINFQRERVGVKEPQYCPDVDERTPDRSKRTPGAPWVIRRARRGRTVTPRQYDTTNTELRQKLPSLPYRERETEENSSAKKGPRNGKRRRGKRKYFSSPVHKKDQPEEDIEIQSTYISYQDEFPQEVLLNVDTSDLSGSPAPLDPAKVELHSSGGVLRSSDSLQRSRLYSSETSPFQISPTTPSDEVFVDEYSKTDIGDKKSFFDRPRGLSLDGLNASESYRYRSKEEEENARIAKLFHEVNAAFGRPLPERKVQDRPKSSPEIPSRNLKKLHHEEKAEEARAICKAPLCENTVHPETRNEAIETIMTNANLQASLDNALCMLNESTKLLDCQSRQGSHGHHPGSKHQLCGVVSPQSHPQVRSRTYSTCSRLETIAEEIDRSDDAPTNITSNVNETTSNGFSDCSEHENPFSYRTRSETRSLMNSASAFHRDSDSYTSSQQSDTLGIRGKQQKNQEEFNAKARWLLRTTSSSTSRHNSTSTISIRNLRKDSTRKETESTVPSPSVSEKCAACEWARKSQLNLPSIPVIPNSAWARIVNSDTSCHDHTHVHPWGVCTEKHSLPVLCHSHYLQYYQYLQNNSRNSIHQRRGPHSVSSQADSFIDYDINEVLSSLDEFVASENSILSSTNSSVSNLHRGFHHSAHDCLHHNTGHLSLAANTNPRHYVDTKHYHTHKQSDTDVSINSDSAFSTNGSLTPSTRDGVNTDRESVDSISEGHAADKYQQQRLRANNLVNTNIRRGRKSAQDSHQQRNKDNHPTITKNDESATKGKRIRSFEDPIHPKDFISDVLRNHEKRYSVISSVGSSSSPLTSDPLCDSAVHLQDTSSSHSTQLSSDSFYSSGTSFDDKETCILDRVLDIDSLSRSSSEESLLSEGTLCLSQLAISEQNISLYSVPSFPQISDLCSPSEDDIHQPLRESPLNEESRSFPFQDWINRAEMTESIMRTFMRSNLNDLNGEPTTVPSSNKNRDGAEEKKLFIKQIGMYDSLTSSSGSSDSNTLGSGSSGSTYATSSLRSYSRFNTFDSSSCVSTDDTGETVIDQYMLRPSSLLYNIEEERRKKTTQEGKKRYKPSTFHYENLDMPSIVKPGTGGDAKSRLNDDKTNREPQLVIKGLKRNSELIIAQTKSSSLSCLFTSLEHTVRVARHANSLPNIHFSKYEESLKTIEIVEDSEHISSTKFNTIIDNTLPPKCCRILQTKVDLMMESCNDFNSVINSLRKSLRSPTTSGNLDQKLLELGDILRQKDEMITRLQKMLLAYSAVKDSEARYPASATM